MLDFQVSRQTSTSSSSNHEGVSETEASRQRLAGPEESLLRERDVEEGMPVQRKVQSPHCQAPSSTASDMAQSLAVIILCTPLLKLEGCVCRLLWHCLLELPRIYSSQWWELECWACRMPSGGVGWFKAPL